MAKGDSDRDCSCGSGAVRREEADGQVLRCVCGSLMARYVAGGVELKCRRCKRTVVIPIQQTEAVGTS